jgi:TRAP-type C4-dicarboxylate transport system permease small subunit
MAPPEPVRESVHGADAGLVLGATPAGGALARLTSGLALVGGCFLLAAIALTLISVIGRYGFSSPVPGDYELVEITCAVGTFLFFPYTQAMNGNITAEFFTSALPRRWRRTLDVINDVIFAGVAGLLTWRVGHGLVDKFHSGDSSMMIHIPLWWAYSVAVAAMALLTLVCALRAVEGMRTFPR